MIIQDELLPIERGFWTSGADLDNECVIGFIEIAGKFRRDEIARMITDTQRWNDINLDVKGCLEPAPDFAILTYAVNATRKNKDPYAAVVGQTVLPKQMASWARRRRGDPVRSMTIRSRSLDLEHGLRDGVRGFLRQVVPNAAR